MQIKRWKEKQNGKNWFNKIKLFVFCSSFYFIFFSEKATTENIDESSYSSPTTNCHPFAMRPHNWHFTHRCCAIHSDIKIDIFCFLQNVLRTWFGLLCAWSFCGVETIKCMNFDVSLGLRWIMTTYFTRFSGFKLRLSWYNQMLLLLFAVRRDDAAVFAKKKKIRKKTGKINLASEAHVKNSLLFELWLDLNLP